MLSSFSLTHYYQVIFFFDVGNLVNSDFFYQYVSLLVFMGHSIINKMPLWVENIITVMKAYV